MNQNKIFLCIILVYFNQCNYAQINLTGFVLDQKSHPVTQANILVYKSINGDLFAFGVTDQQGKFVVNHNFLTDSVFIQIEHLTYESYFATVKVSQNQNIILKERVTELPEVKITHSRIQQRGDTIIYDVAQYKKLNDNNIEDILRKLPGIEIEDNGTILYNNEAITHLYIEGIDMLEGRYKIATRGLNVDAVSEVQVLERHQHIKALKDLVVPKSAAINVKLKSSITHTGQYEGGLGLSPILYNLKGSLFGFSKNYQYGLFGAANNFGRDNRDLFQKMTVVVLDGQNNLGNQGLIDVTHPLTPRLRNELYRFNNEKVLGVNFLKKLTDNTQFKYNSSSHIDNLRMEGSNYFTLSDPINTFIISERLSTVWRNQGMDHSIKLETNKSKLFFAADILGEILPSTILGDHNINNNKVLENLKKSIRNLSADMKFIIRKGLKAYSINSYIEFRDINDTLFILPTSFDLPGTGFLSQTSADQIVKQQLIKSHTYTSFFTKKNQLSYETSLGIKTSHLWLKSSLEGFDSTISDQFSNDIFNGGIRFYTNQKITKEKKKWTYDLSLPLSLQFFALQNSEKLKKSNQGQFILYQPAASISYKFNYKYTTSLTVSYNNYADFQQLYFDRYILTSNRNLSRRLPQAFQSKGINLSSNHIFTNLFGRNDHFFTSFHWNCGSQNQLQNNNFNTTSVVLDVTNINNKVSGLGSTGMFKSEVFTRDFVLNLNYYVMISFFDQVLNEVMVKVRNDTWYIHGSIDYSLFDRLGLKANINFNRFVTNFSPAANNITYTGQLYINPYKNIDWKINLDLAQNITINESSKNAVLGTEIEYKLSSSKLRFSLQLTNLTNNKNFQSLSQSLFTMQESYLRLRPRQLFISVKKLI